MAKEKDKVGDLSEKFELKFAENFENSAILSAPNTEPSITFHVTDEAPEELLRFTKDKMYLRGKETECPKDIIEGMRAWLTNWNYIATQPTNEEGVTITKCPQEGELIILIDNDNITSRMSVNPWTMKVSDYKYSLKNGK